MGRKRIKSFLAVFTAISFFCTYGIIGCATTTRDAGVTTSAIVTGLAIPPPAGPLVAAGIILTRVGWGLFQKDPYDE